MGPITFGVRNLNDLSTYVTSVVRLPDFNNALQRLPLATLEGSSLSVVQFPETIAEVVGWLHADTDQATQDARDTLLLALSQNEQQLRLGVEDNRYWLARTASCKFVTINPLGYEFTAQFVCLRPFANASSANANVIDNAALTLVSGIHYSKSISVPIGGTVWAWPVITITFPAGGGSPWDTSSVWVYNASTGQQLTLLHGFAASDVIVIDAQAETVTVDGVLIDSVGQFPYIDPRAGVSNTLEVHSLSTPTPTLNVTISTRNRFR